MKCIGNGESRDIVVLLKDRIDSLTKQFNQNVAYIEDINASDISEEEKEMKTQCAREENSYILIKLSCAYQKLHPDTLC